MLFYDKAFQNGQGCLLIDEVSFRLFRLFSKAVTIGFSHLKKNDDLVGLLASVAIQP